MRGRAIAAALAVCAATLLAGCTPWPSTPDRPAIFEREQTESDTFPLSLPDTYDPASIRYVGEDSAGDRYWVGRSGTGHCILWRAASGTD